MEFTILACDLSKNPEPTLKSFTPAELISALEVLYGILKSIRIKNKVSFLGHICDIETQLDQPRKIIKVDGGCVTVRVDDDKKLIQRLWKMVQFILTLLGKLKN